jgi:hypothetical protein
VTPDELAVLRLELVEATRLSFEACRREKRDQTLYGYALVMCSIAGEALQPWCHSEESFARAEAGSSGRPEEAGLRRYCPDEWWSIVSGPVRTRRGSDFGAIRAGLGTAYEQFRAANQYIVLEMLIDALGMLDREGFFGSGAAREAVTLMVYVSDSSLSEEWWPESVRRLNPPAVVARFEAAVL